MNFEADEGSLRRDLDDTRTRIQKLGRHLESETGRANPDRETVRRLERNLRNLRKREELILCEIEGVTASSTSDRG